MKKSLAKNVHLSVRDKSDIMRRLVQKVTAIAKKPMPPEYDFENFGRIPVQSSSRSDDYDSDFDDSDEDDSDDEA